MMERSGRILSLHAESMIVTVDTAPACSQCGSRKACHGGSSELTLALPAGPGLKPGDLVTLALPAGRLNHAALLAWLLPALALLAGAALGQWSNGQDSGAILGAATGLLAGLASARRLARRLDGEHFEPCITAPFETQPRSPTR
ncbi:SoxR reducing system RseC family protein [Uliginosibacterium paludis]|uniref:SoxR reducing system RseC family protein n=1 Tax=Uliginosibacterium paludis TaxID=1615952 RepID=A0ABV2CVK2_9RHOO